MNCEALQPLTRALAWPILVLSIAWLIPHEPTVVYYAQALEVPGPDALRDSAIVYWSRIWDVDEALMLYVSNEVENWSGDPTALGPRFCLERAGQEDVGGDLVGRDQSNSRLEPARPQPERSGDANGRGLSRRQVFSDVTTGVSGSPTPYGVSDEVSPAIGTQLEHAGDTPVDAAVAPSKPLDVASAPGTCLQYTQAVGVMQVVPEVHVGTDNARMCAVRRRDDLFRSWPNACLGVLIYRTYLMECGGDVMCALGKYGGVATLAGRYYLRLYDSVVEE